jgi:uncharacterized membrane protein
LNRMRVSKSAIEMKTGSTISALAAALISLIWVVPWVAIVIGVVFGLLVYLATLEIEE